MLQEAVLAHPETSPDALARDIVEDGEAGGASLGSGTGFTTPIRARYACFR